MVESERISNKLSLASTYYNEEIRDGFVVESFRKKLWAIELDLLFEIDRVCKKYNLRYFLFFGSLLGAIRHKGFIPWDDDIDVIMPRRDYQEFIKHGNEFSFPYFLQNCFTDKDFFFVHSRLRNSKTTAIQRPFATREFNHGIFVDILYYDEFSDSKEGEVLFNDIVKDIIKISTYMKLDNPYPNKKDSERILNYDGEAPFDIFDRIQKKSQKYDSNKTGYIATTSAVVYGYKRCHFHAEDFDSQIWMDFEGFKFPIPSGWERILRDIYGNYLQLPPLADRGGWHGSLWYDPDKSYMEIKQTDKFFNWLKKEY